MNELILVDYIGNCDSAGNPTGHVIKTLTETGELLENDFDVKYIIAKTHVAYFSKDKIKKKLDYFSCPSVQDTLYKKIKLRIKKMCSVWNIVTQEKKVWFINTDFWFFLALAIYPRKKKNKIYATNYLDYYHDGGVGKRIKKFIYKIACRNIDCVFTTDSGVHLPKHQYIPDYWYDSDKYMAFYSSIKRNCAYICGGINPGKDIVGAIKAFNESGFPLVVNGSFSDKMVLEESKRIANTNISIHDERLTNEEYYTSLGQYKYVLLPYRKENYSNRSSGVILEAIFLGAIIIAPNFLLKHLGVEGIGYDDIAELGGIDLDAIEEIKKEKMLSKNLELVAQYSVETIKEEYIRWLKGGDNK